MTQFNYVEQCFAIRAPDSLLDFLFWTWICPQSSSKSNIFNPESLLFWFKVNESFLSASFRSQWPDNRTLPSVNNVRNSAIKNMKSEIRCTPIMANVSWENNKLKHLRAFTTFHFYLTKDIPSHSHWYFFNLFQMAFSNCSSKMLWML